VTLVQRSVQKFAAMLGASGSRWEPNNKARVVLDRNDGITVTELIVQE
jgi:hypothetical protein